MPSNIFGRFELYLIFTSKMFVHMVLEPICILFHNMTSFICNLTGSCKNCGITYLVSSKSFWLVSYLMWSKNSLNSFLIVSLYINSLSAPIEGTFFTHAKASNTLCNRIYTNTVLITLFFS